MVEVWKDIVGYEGKYKVSNMGKVKSLKDNHGNYREKILKSRLNRDGYMHIILYKDGKSKTHKVHRLVAMAFVDGYEEGLVVNHIDEDKINNCAWNLEWCTSKYNANYGTRNERASEKNKGRKHSEESKKKMSESKKGKYIGSKNPRARKVICIDTGHIFETVSEAEKFIGVSHGCITQAIKKGRSCKGLHWKYVN